MSKYIDADRFRMELEKRLKNVRDYMNGAGMKYKGPKYFRAQGRESAYDAILNTIGSLQQEQQEEPVSEDLEKEIDAYYKEWDGDCRYVQTARHFAKWGAEHLRDSTKKISNDRTIV